MKLLKTSGIFLLTVLLHLNAIACSMYKVTSNGHTYVGNNEDSWRINPSMRFEPGDAGKLGAVFFEYANFRGLPEGAMNEAGLVFDGFMVQGKRLDTNAPNFCKPGMLEEIMHSCKTVSDVKQMISHCNGYFFQYGMLFFVDADGNYLITEPDTLLEGKDPDYVLANFRPSVACEADKAKFGRYNRGTAFLQTQPEFDFAAACSMSDAMHECREGMGDGTMYSSVYDLSKREFSLFFYHDYQHPMHFNLHEELKKGQQIVLMEDIFPENAEYLRLKSYINPQNHPKVLYAMFAVAFLLAIFAFSMGLGFLNQLIFKRNGSKSLSYLALALLSTCTLAYLAEIMLPRNHIIYYFPAPYTSPYDTLLSISSYWPPILAACLLGIAIFVGLRFRKTKTIQQIGIWSGLNFGVLVLCTLAFAYWGLLSVWP